MMRDAYLFAAAIAKCALITGLGPGILLAVFGPRFAKFRRPVTLNKPFLIKGHYLGDFIGTVEAVERDVAHVRVTDTLRPAPRVRNRCAFPQCIRQDFHYGDHEFPRICWGELVAIDWHTAKFVPIEKSSGDGQLAAASIPALSKQATSPSRKRSA
jgi:hypothetical protein